MQAGQDTGGDTEAARAGSVGDGVADTNAPVRVTMATRIEQLSSQGVVVSSDSTATFVHDSTSPAGYYKYLYNVDEGMNMDRGGFGQTSTGTNFGCVFDGVTAGGKLNAYAAQAFTDHTLRFLHQYHVHFQHGTGINEKLSRQLFTEATNHHNNPGRINREYQAEGGSATGAFVTFEANGKGHAVVNGAAIGDAAAIVVYRDQDRARQLNSVHRRNRNPRDTGGQVTMCLGVEGDVWNFSEPLARNDLVVLTTDGLTDNVSVSELPTVIPLIVTARCFDTVPTSTCSSTTGPLAHLPSLTELRTFVGEDLDSLLTITCRQAAQRLVNYIVWVTGRMYEQEQAFYAAEMRKRDLMALATPEAKVELHIVEQELKDMLARRKSGTAGKTDDAFVLVMEPFHRHAIATARSPRQRAGEQAHPPINDN